MGCGCRKARAGGKTAGGRTVLGYEVTFPPALQRAPETYLTRIEAQVAMRSAGGGTVRTKVA